MKKLLTTVMFSIGGVTLSWGQCAMCRATLENNLSNGDPGIAAGINIGIMYLFIAPYLMVGVVAYFWFKTSRSNARKELEKRTLVR